MTAFPALLRLFRGRKRKQDKGLASEPTLCPVTSARSAGSLRGFSSQSVVAPFEENFRAAGVLVPANADVPKVLVVPYGCF